MQKNVCPTLVPGSILLTLTHVLPKGLPILPEVRECVPGSMLLTLTHCHRLPHMSCQSYLCTLLFPYIISWLWENMNVRKGGLGNEL